MILIFDYFNTLLGRKDLDFNRGLKVFWEQHYQDKCSFDEFKLKDATRDTFIINHQ